MTENPGILAHQHCCNRMVQQLEAREMAIMYVPKLREYGLRVLDSGSSYVVLNFCPWCGKMLPAGLRNEWLMALERLALEPGSSNIPRSLTTDQWWIDAKLEDEPGRR